MIKGIAILIMIYHHFFGGYAVPINISDIGQNDPLFYILSLRAHSGKICISLFAFITGYGFYYIITKEQKSIIRAVLARLKRVYLFFLFISFLIFILVNIYPCHISFNLSRWPMQLRGSLPDHWYISVVLVSCLLYFPILLWGYRKGNLIHTIAFYILTTLNIIILTVPFVRQLIGGTSIISQEVMKTMPFFMLGYAMHYIENDDISKLKKYFIFSASIVLCLVGYNEKWAFVILFCTLLVNCKFVKETSIGSFLAYLGTYSMCMWLNHRLIFGYWFVDPIYKIPTPLNYVLIVAGSLILSIALTKTYNKIAHSLTNR